MVWDLRVGGGIEVDWCAWRGENRRIDSLTF